MTRTIKQKKATLGKVRFRRMRHFTIPEFGVVGEHYDAKNNIEDMTFYILDRLWDAWEIYCSAQDLGSGILCIKKGWRGYNPSHPSDPFFRGCAVELDPMNNRTDIFHRFCAVWFEEESRFDEVSPTSTGVKIIFKNAKKEQRKLVFLREKL